MSATSRSGTGARVAGGARRRLLAGLGLAFLIGSTMQGAGFANARPLTPAEQRFQAYSGVVPPCTEPGALAAIQSRFKDREDEYWHSGLEIVSFDKVDEIGFRSNGLDYIPRRYCVAEAVMNDQKLRLVSFSIGEGLGSIGFTDGVDFCVSGLDRTDAYSPSCKMARP